MVTALLPASALRIVVGRRVLFRNVWSEAEEFGSQRFGGSTWLLTPSLSLSNLLCGLWEVKGRDYVVICMKISYNFSRNYTQERQGKMAFV